MNEGDFPLDSFGFGTLFDTIIVSIWCFLFWWINFRFTFGAEFKAIDYNMNQSTYWNKFYCIFTFVINGAPSLILIESDFAKVSQLLRIYQVMNSIMWNLFDMWFYKHNITNKLHPIHHSLVITASFCAYFVPFINAASQILAVVEFGSFFADLIFNIYQKYAKTSLVCIMILASTRMFLCYKWIWCLLYLMYYDYSFIFGQYGRDYATFGLICSIVFVVLVFCVLVLNCYFLYRHIVRWQKHHGSNVKQS